MTQNKILLYSNFKNVKYLHVKPSSVVQVKVSPKAELPATGTILNLNVKQSDVSSRSLGLVADKKFAPKVWDTENFQLS